MNTPDECLPKMDPLPPPPMGRNYTRMCIAALRRHAQKMPTLSGVADHVQAIDEELGAWEGRARQLFSLAQQFREKYEQINIQSQEKDRNIEGLFDDFAGERDLWEENKAQLDDRLAKMNHQIEVLNANLDLSQRQLSASQESAEGLGVQIQGLLSEVSSLRSFHESVVRDLDSSEARLHAQLRALTEENKQIEAALSESVRSHGNDVSAATQVIAQLRFENAHASEIISDFQQAQVRWDILRRDLEIQSRDLRQELVDQIRSTTQAQEKSREKDAQISHISEQKDHIQHSYDQLCEQHAAARAQIQERQDKVEALLLETEHQRYVSSQLVENIEALTQEVSLRLSFSQDLENKLEGLRHQLSLSHSLVHDLTEKEKAAERDLEEAMGWASELEALANSTAKDLAQAQGEIHQLAQDRQQDTLAHKQQLSKLSDLHTDKIVHLNEQISQAYNRIQDLDEENSKGQSQTASLREALAEKTHQMRLMEEEGQKRLEELGALHKNDVSQIQSGYEFDLIDAAEQISRTQEQVRYLEQMLALGSEEGQRAFNDLLDEHERLNQKIQHRHREELENTSSKYNSLLSKSQDDLFQSQFQLYQKEGELELAQNRIALLERNLELAQDQASRLPGMEHQLATVQEALFIQNKEIQDMEIIVLQHSACISDYDDSVPWDIRAWEGPQGEERFTPVPGVPQWLADNGWSVQDFTKKKFPGHSSADREHLAMVSGMRLSEFLELPWVRPGIKKNIETKLRSGDRALSTHGQWQAMGTNSLVWRTNKFWSHLLDVSRTTSPKDWGVYLHGGKVGVC